MHGASAVPVEARARLAGGAQLEVAIERWLAHGRTAGAIA
jgi:hypothetical protein